MYSATAPRTSLNFSVVATDPSSNARAARFETAHGVVETPIFMPVATHGALRGVDTSIAEAMGYQVLLANTYHLLLHPGPALFEKVGGIQKFMSWPRSVLTDSGGFQIFSLARLLKMTEEGARFRSYRDGREVLLTPEISIATQRAIGSDIMMVLDHCIDSTSDETTTRNAMELTTRWAKRSFDARGDSSQALFGIVQGACFPKLRSESAKQITDIPFDGYALGGLAVGETKNEREDIVEHTAVLLPHDRPRYLMGVGTPIDLLEAVKRGMDMFDCIIPTALGHQGVAFTSSGRVDLTRGAFESSESPLDAECSCSTCIRFSRAYLHHLLCAREFVSGQLVAVHNLAFYKTLMARMREQIIAGTFGEFYRIQRERLVAKDDEFPEVPPKVKAKPAGEESTLGDYTIVTHPNGYGSIRQISSGETMHSVVDPADEALALYHGQSGVETLAASAGEDLVIWDVGLGAATNAMTSILRLEGNPSMQRKIRIISFERDLDPLKLALRVPRLFKHLRHGAPHALLKQGAWSSTEGVIQWTLLAGDFTETMHGAEAPDIIWFDPFSFKVDAPLWRTESFKRILAACGAKETKLFTYTASTAARAAMLAAGWYVGSGIGTGPKSETTIAYTERAVRSSLSTALLSSEWLARWERSDAKQPFGEATEAACERIRSHPQFRVA